MTTAIALNAQSTIINGHGLQESANLIAQISTFQSHPIIPLMANTYALAITSNSNVAILASLANLCVGVSAGQWIIDAYPGNITPVSSGATNPHSFSSTINTQAGLPFAYGLSGFANVFQTAYGFMQSGFETVASIYMLTGKSYAQSGLGYTGPKDLATNGINSNGYLYGNVVSKWGTMYDVNNIGTASDPYVFGQNLLNQGLGQYGNLSAKLSAAGLNVNNLTQIPQNTTTTSQAQVNVATSTPIGSVDLPTLANITTTTVVSGTSASVIQSIYQSITGADLQNIVTATNVTISNSSITTLADYLNFNSITSPADYASLSSLGITTFLGFTTTLQSKVGSGFFKSWADMASMLTHIEVPVLTYTSATSTDPVLLSSTISTLLTANGTGTGPFNNLILTDMLGAVTGVPYTPLFQTLNTSYNSLNTNKVYLAALALNNAILGNVDAPDIPGLDANVANVNSQINSLTIPVAGQTAYYQMLNHLTQEVTNLSSAGVAFNSGYAGALNGFGQSIGYTASDKTQFQTYQFFANLITNDVYGDTIRSAITESINTTVLGTKGITVNNDPNPQLALSQSQIQNIPLTTYLSQNK
jgi:hypothetical protein